MSAADPSTFDNERARALWAATRVRVWAEPVVLASLPVEKAAAAAALAGHAGAGFVALVRARDEVSLTIPEAAWRRRPRSSRSSLYMSARRRRPRAESTRAAKARGFTRSPASSWVTKDSTSANRSRYSESSVRMLLRAAARAVSDPRRTRSR